MYVTNSHALNQAIERSRDLIMVDDCDEEYCHECPNYPDCPGVQNQERR